MLKISSEANDLVLFLKFSSDLVKDHAPHVLTLSLRTILDELKEYQLFL